MPLYDIDHYRQLFPHVRSGLCYLNHAAVSPFSTRVTEAIQRYLRMKSDTDPEPFEEVLETLVETKRRIGTLIHAASERIAVLDNTSNGLNIVAAGLDWKSGDRVLLNDMEFPANVYPFLNLQRLGVEVDFVRNRNGTLAPEDLEAALTPRTRLLSVSHVQFLHGFRSDLAAIGEVCRRRQVVFTVDAIQSAGAIPIDVEEMRIDFLAAGGQKWLMAPEGIAFAYVSEALQERLHLGTMGWMNIKNFFSDFFRYRLDLEDTARRFENGTFNCAGVYGLHASLELLLEVGIGNIEQHLHSLTSGVVRWAQEQGVPLVSPAEKGSRAGIVTVRPPNAPKMFERLKNAKIHISLREGCIRFSPHFYNTEEEIDRALDAALSVMP